MWFKVSIKNSPRLSRFPYQVKEIGYTHGGIVPRVGGCCSDRFEFCIRMYSQESEAIDYLDGVKYITGFPHVVIKSPQIHHQYATKVPREAISVIYTPETEKSLRDLFRFPDVPIWNIELNHTKNKLIAELTEMTKSSHDYGIADQIDMVALQLVELLIFDAASQTSRQDHYEVKIRKIASYFQIHYREKIDILALAAHHGMSRSTFIRHWNRFYDCPPGQYLINLKFQHACQSLSSNLKLKIHEISGDLGFNDTEHFCAMFKKRYGLTPNEYRKIHNSQN